MIILYGWLALLGLILLLLVIKLIISIVLAVRGQRNDWSQYNGVLLTLTFIAFLPIGVLWYLVKSVK